MDRGHHQPPGHIGARRTAPAADRGSGTSGVDEYGRRLHGANRLMRSVSGPNTRVVVVGAGLAGLTAALHLAGRGREVTVVERESWPGGRAGRLDINGYQLDTGPTVLTMPDIIDEAFAAVGESRSDRLDLMTVD